MERTIQYTDMRGYSFIAVSVTSNYGFGGKKKHFAVEMKTKYKSCYTSFLDGFQHLGLSGASGENERAGSSVHSLMYALGYTGAGIT